MKSKNPPSLCTGQELALSRREWLTRSSLGLGTMALGQLASSPAAEAATHLAPKAKRIIYLFQSGAPSQIDLFDHKPLLAEREGEQLPESVRGGQRLTGMSANQSSIPLVGSPWPFRRHGQSGLSMSDLLPYTSGIADDIAVVKSMHTEAINHGPGVTMMQTGSQIPGRPSFGAWLQYGLGSESENLPAFVVLVTKEKGGQPLVSRLWGSGFLPSKYQGARFRSGKDPVLYLNNPSGIDRTSRESMIESLQDLHRHSLEKHFDPMVETRIAQYEMAFRMQMSIPEVTDLSKEPASVVDSYGPDARKPGTFAANCLLARRLAEKGVRFIQLYHPGWDHHGNIPSGVPRQCKETDQPSAALIRDLKQRGLLEDTLVIWGGEFGRTNYCQGKFTKKSFGRDHHPRCFSIWMAGGGIKPGTSFGETDDYGYNVAKDPVHVHDLHATLLHLLGIHHEKLTFKYQGRHFRLTDVHGHVVQPILA
ncbi:MAG: DUF1501 domain-containing protein [Verrucomicrobiota bacterium]